MDVPVVRVGSPVNVVGLGAPGDSNTINGPIGNTQTGLSSENRPMYGLSQVFVVGASTDATLSALTVNDGTNDLTLSPAFASGTYTYAANVGNAVTSVTLTATPNHAGGSVTGVTLGGTVIADTDFTDGITVPSLGVDDNVIVVTVTAEDTSTTRTYTVTVTRAAVPTTPVTALVSNTGATAGLETAIVGRAVPPLNLLYDQAQRFMTGDNPDGYALSEIVAHLVDIGADAVPRVSIYSATAGGLPDSSLYVLDNPASFSDGNNTFTASGNAPLDPEEKYFVVFENTASGVGTTAKQYYVRSTSSSDEDLGGASGWCIRDDHNTKTSFSGTWGSVDDALLVAVRGSANAFPARARHGPRSGSERRSHLPLFRRGSRSRQPAPHQRPSPSPPPARRSPSPPSMSAPGP